MDPKVADQYRTQQVMNASPPMLVAMLYDQAIRSLNRAIAAIETGDIQARWSANKNATDCLWELAASLDVDSGGEIAGYLDQLYRFMAHRLLQVDLRNDPAPAVEVIGLLEPLRDSWREIAKQQADEPLATDDAGDRQSVRVSA